MRLTLVCCALAIAALGAFGAGATTAGPDAGRSGGLRVGVSPRAAARHEPVAVTITTRRTTGVRGHVIRSYRAEARSVHPASACVNNRDRFFPDGRAGRRVRATLDPRRGDGGPLGWCRGRFRGSVIYTEAYACPRRRACHPPRSFELVRRVVARFTFRVRGGPGSSGSPVLGCGRR